jgi:hypothetical protein
MFLRSCAIAIAALLLSGGISSSQADHYNKDARYPWGAFGQRAYIATKSNPHHPAARSVTCDRSRDVCYDRFGISYHATKRYLGERKANRSYRKYGDQVLLFSPARGIVCDRRTDSCTRARWGGPGYGWGNQGYGSGNYGGGWGGNHGYGSGSHGDGWGGNYGYGATPSHPWREEGSASPGWYEQNQQNPYWRRPND